MRRTYLSQLPPRRTHHLLVLLEFLPRYCKRKRAIASIEMSFFGCLEAEFVVQNLLIYSMA
jgi:hypothetical protein